MADEKKPSTKDSARRSTEAEVLKSEVEGMIRTFGGGKTQWPPEAHLLMVETHQLLGRFERALAELARRDIKKAKARLAETYGKLGFDDFQMELCKELEKRAKPKATAGDAWLVRLFIGMHPLSPRCGREGPALHHFGGPVSLSPVKEATIMKALEAWVDVKPGPRKRGKGNAEPKGQVASTRGVAASVKWTAALLKECGVGIAPKTLANDLSHYRRDWHPKPKRK